jgi:uncharacterized protein YqgQ
MAEIFLTVKTDASQSVTTIGELEGNVKKLKGELKGVAIGSEEFKKMNTELKGMQSTLKGATTLTTGLNTGIKSVKGLQLELKAMAAELMAIEQEANVAFQMGDDASFAKAKAKHAERTKQMSELRGDMDDLKNANKYLDAGNLMKGYSLLASSAVGAFGAVSAGLQLAGIQNKAFEESLKQAGLVVEFLTGLESARQLVLDAGGIKQIATMIKTTALKAADIAMTVGLTVATGAATVAMGIFNVVASLNPLGLVVLAGAALIGIFVALYEWTGSLTEALLWMVNPVGMLVSLFLDSAQAQNEDTAAKEKAIAAAHAQTVAAQKVVESLKKELVQMEKNHETMKARGATEAQLFADVLKMHDKKIQIAKAEGVLEEKLFREKMARGEWDAQQALKVINSKGKVKAAEAAKDKDLKDKSDADEKERVEKARDNEKIRQADRKNYLKNLEKNEAEHNLKMAEASGDLLKIYNAQDAVAIQNKKQLIADQQALLKRGVITKAEYDAEIKRIDEETNIQLKENLKTYSLAIADNQKEIKAAKDKALEEDKKRADKEKELLLSQKEFHEEVVRGMLEYRIAHADNSKKRIEERIALIKFESDKEKAELKKKYDDGLIDLSDYLTAKQVLLNKQYDAEEAVRKEENQKEIDAYKAQVENLKSIFSADNFGFINDSLTAVFDVAFANIGSSLEVLANKSSTTMEKITAAFGAVANTLQSVFQSVNESIQATQEEEIAAAQTQYEETEKGYKAFLNAGLDSQEDYDKKVAIANKSKEDKEKAAKINAWEQQKKIAVANAILQGIMATLNAYTSGLAVPIIGPATGLIFAGIAAAFAGVQIGMISKSKPPAFKDGGLVKGAGTGTSDSIDAKLSNGEFVMNAASTAKWLPLLQNLNSPSSAPAISAPVTPAEAVARAVYNSNAAPTRVYVVESDISESSERASKMRRRAELS